MQGTKTGNQDGKVRQVTKTGNEDEEPRLRTKTKNGEKRMKKITRIPCTVYSVSENNFKNGFAIFS